MSEHEELVEQVCEILHLEYLPEEDSTEESETMKRVRKAIEMVQIHERAQAAETVKGDVGQRVIAEARNGSAVWNHEETMVVEGEEGTEQDIAEALADLILHPEAEQPKAEPTPRSGPAPLGNPDWQLRERLGTRGCTVWLEGDTWQAQVHGEAIRATYGSGDTLYAAIHAALEARELKEASL